MTAGTNGWMSGIGCTGTLARLNATVYSKVKPIVKSSWEMVIGVLSSSGKKEAIVLRSENWPLQTPVPRRDH